jgi:protein-S-isoprenylcysteine O-methyltransferase Ste14
MTLQREWEVQGNFLFKHRSYLPLTLIPAALWVTYLAVNSRPEMFSNLDITLPEIFCLISSFIGLLTRVITVAFTPANTSGRNTAHGQVADVLNSNGMYSMVRHPLYLGNYFMWLGIALLTANICFVILFSLAYWLYYERIMYAEEQFLTRKFGQLYLDWAGSTPAFIPAFKKWTRSNLTFSWKKAVSKEKNGVLAVFLLLFIWNCWTHWVMTGHWMPEKSWTLIALAVSAGYYVIIKLIDKRTSWLKEEGR